MCKFHPHDEPVAHLRGSRRTRSVVLHNIRVSSVWKRGLVCRIITCTRSGTKPSRWISGIPLSLETPFRQHAPHFLLKVTNNLFYLQFAHLFLTAFYFHPYFKSLTHAYSTHAYRADWELKMKGRGSCASASGAVWVGKWWKRSSFSNLTAPFRSFFLSIFSSMKGLGPSQLQIYSNQARGKCYIPACIKSDSVSVSL